LELATDQQAEIDSEVVLALDDEIVQWRDPTSVSEDEDDMGEMSHDVLEQEAYSELVSHCSYMI
jgi:hypothetical protein